MPNPRIRSPWNPDIESDKYLAVIGEAMQFEMIDFALIVIIGAVYLASLLIYNRFAKVEEED